MNKAALLPKIYSALAIGLLSASTATQSRAAETTTTTFLCGTSNGAPATIARTPRAEVPMFLWNSPNIAQTGDSPQKRCEEIARRLQFYYNNGTLKYITTAFRNGQTVVCVAEEVNGSCSGDPLFALNLSVNSKPADTLQRIFRIRVASAGPIVETNASVYISLDKYLNGEYMPIASPNRSQSENSFR